MWTDISHQKEHHNTKNIVVFVWNCTVCMVETAGWVPQWKGNYWEEKIARCFWLLGLQVVNFWAFIKGMFGELPKWRHGARTMFHYVGAYRYLSNIFGKDTELWWVSDLTCQKHCPWNQTHWMNYHEWLVMQSSNLWGSLSHIYCLHREYLH